MTDFPDDINQLKAMLLELQQQNEAKDKLLEAKQEEVAELKTKVQLLVEQLNLSKSKRFTAQSEKTPKVTFNEAEQQNTVSTSESQKKKRGRNPLPEELECEVHKHELNAPYCECCNEPLHQCGVETSEELKIIPQKVSVIRHVRTKYACRQCEKTHTESKIVTAPKPGSMIQKSQGSADAFAAVVTAKYVDALPLYRQVGILNRSGIDISRATLANCCVQLGNKVQIIIDAMKTELLKEELICADETTVQVLREEDKKAQSKSNMWVYRSGEYVDNPMVIYDYHPSRKAECVQHFLADYSGYLHSDGYVTLPEKLAAGN